MSQPDCSVFIYVYDCISSSFLSVQRFFRVLNTDLSSRRLVQLLTKRRLAHPCSLSLNHLTSYYPSNARE